MLNNKNLIVFFFLAFLINAPNCLADIALNKNPLTNDVRDFHTILLVGIKPSELAEREEGLLNGKEVVQVELSENWKQSIERSRASEVLLRQNSGFVGLYSAKGNLIRTVELKDGSNPLQTEPYAAIHQDLIEEQMDRDHGYIAGGRIDPYRPRTLIYEPQNNAQLTPGWGYNSEYYKPSSKRSMLISFLNFAPIDTTTPLNYPGLFDQRGLTTAYGLGVIPHIGGLAASMMRAGSDRKDYDYYRQANAVPEYLEHPTIYYRDNYGEPGNPISTDPNMIRYQQMPQAFNQSFPNYGMYGQNFGTQYHR